MKLNDCRMSRHRCSPFFVWILKFQSLPRNYQTLRSINPNFWTFSRSASAPQHFGWVGCRKDYKFERASIMTVWWSWFYEWLGSGVVFPKLNFTLGSLANFTKNFEVPYFRETDYSSQCGDYDGSTSLHSVLLFITLLSSIHLPWWDEAEALPLFWELHWRYERFRRQQKLLSHDLAPESSCIVSVFVDLQESTEGCSRTCGRPFLSVWGFGGSQKSRVKLV